MPKKYPQQSYLAGNLVYAVGGFISNFYDAVVRSMRCAVHCFEQSFNSGSSFTGVSSENCIYTACDEIMKLRFLTFLLSVIPVVSLLHVLPFYLKLLIRKEIVADHSVVVC